MGEARNAAMIVRARVVVPMDGAPIENGAVATSRERIVDVGTFGAVRVRNSGDVTDLGETALLPGLINAHCHLDYTMLRGSISPQSSFTSWIREMNARKTAFGPEDYISAINDGFAEARSFGTTSIVNYEAFPELIDCVSDSLRTWWCAEMIDVRPGSDTTAAFASACTAVHGIARGGLAPHAPFTASADLYRRSAAEMEMLHTTHLGESPEEMAMFRDRTGALHDFLENIGRDMSDCGGITPAGWFFNATNQSQARAWLLAHMNELSAEDFELLAERREQLSVVHCPRSHAYFGHTPFEFEQLRNVGINVCIGTDSLATTPDLSLLAELRDFMSRHAAVTPAEALKLVTVNAARALGCAGELGAITPGAVADMIAVPFAATDIDSAHEEIVNYTGRVSWMMLNGETQAQ